MLLSRTGSDESSAGVPTVSPRDPATGTVNEKVAPCPGALPNRMEPPFPSMMP